MRIALVAMTTALSGCLVHFDETTFVKVREPSEVTVGVQSPRGGEWLLAAEGPPETKELPDTNPPLTEGHKFAMVARQPGGRVTLECPSCVDAQHGEVVAREIALKGDSARTVRWSSNPDRLGMRFSHLASFPCRRHPDEPCPREAVTLWLSTPKENVVEIRRVKTIDLAPRERVGGWAATIFGGLAFSAGAALAVGYALEGGDAKRGASSGGAVLGAAGAVMAVGAACIVMGILIFRARGSDEVVYRASPRPVVP